MLDDPLRRPISNDIIFIDDSRNERDVHHMGCADGDGVANRLGRIFIGCTRVYTEVSSVDFLHHIDDTLRLENLMSLKSVR